VNNLEKLEIMNYKVRAEVNILSNKVSEVELENLVLK
jgi:hypothetical protein